MRQRTVLVLGLAIALIVTGAVVGIVMQSGSQAAAVRAIPPEGQEEFPAEPLGPSRAQLSRALPGTEGMAGEGPAAVPKRSSWSAPTRPTRSRSRQMDGARAAFAQRRAGRSRGAGASRAPGSASGRARRSIPSTQFLTSFIYVPNAYIAGGRTTAIAISDSCKPGNCRMYITPAGGGIWRTKNALAGDSRTGSTSAGRSGSTPPAP